MQTSNVYNFAGSIFGEEREEIAKLAARAKSGDDKAFGQIYDLFFQKIYRFIYFRVGHKEVAEDLAEEVFIKCHTKLSGLTQDSQFLGWLYQIARNSVIDYYRQKKLTVDLQDVENTLEYETNVVDLMNLEYRQAILIKLLKELSTEQQSVIKMKFLEDLDNSEIARILDTNEGNIRVIQHRAINKLIELRKKLDDQDE